MPARTRRFPELSPWPERDDELRELFARMPPLQQKQIAAIMELPHLLVKSRLQALKLRRNDKETLQRQAQERAEREAAAAPIRSKTTLPPLPSLSQEK